MPLVTRRLPALVSYFAPGAEIPEGCCLAVSENLRDGKYGVRLTRFSAR
jgi:hypothetical protein